jgi:hypothetical protein
MGLLDEAIREHLELKRRSGADPSAVAREEREALAPLFEEEPTAHELPEEQPASDAHDPVYVEEAPTEAHTLTTSEPPPAEEHSGIGQETAELDMESMISDDPAAGADGDSPDRTQGHSSLE